MRRLPERGETCAAKRKNAAKPNAVETGHGVPLQADIEVGSMMKKDQERYPERREELLNLLGVDPHWRMHQVNKLLLVDEKHFGIDANAGT